MHDTDRRSGLTASEPITPAHRRYLIRLTIISTLGGLLFGYDTGVISGALLFIGKDLHLSTTQQTFVVTSLLFGAIIGSQIGGRMADAIGRRASLRIYAVVFFFGALGSGQSPTLPLIYASRVVLGLAVGAAAATVPLYLSEMAPAHRRGRMTTINELMIVSGQFIAFGINELINSLAHGNQHVWRTMLTVAAIPAIALFIGMFFLPDSPRWYALKGRLDDARRVLALSRGPAEADGRGHLPAGQGQPAPLVVYRVRRGRGLRPRPRDLVQVPGLDYPQLPHPGLHHAVRLLRPDVHRHPDLADAVGDLPDGHPGLLHGHRRFLPLEHQHGHLVRVPVHDHEPGVVGHVRDLRRDQRHLAAVRVQVRAGNPRPHPGGAGRRVPLPRRRPPRPPGTGGRDGS